MTYHLRLIKHSFQWVLSLREAVSCIIIRNCKSSGGFLLLSSLFGTCSAVRQLP